MDVIVRSHSFEVCNFDPQFKKALVEFCTKYTLYKTTRDWRTGIVTKTPDVTYAARFRDNTRFFFHISVLEQFKKFTGERKIIFNTTEIPLYEPVKVNFDKYRGETRDYQEGQIEYALGEGRSKLIGLQTGKGKAQPMHAVIKTPTGFTTMGALKVGDTIIAWDGTPTQVLALYPQGNKLTFTVTVNKNMTGLFTADHLWRVYLGEKDVPLGPYYYTTKDIIEMIYGSGIKVYINSYKSNVLNEITSIDKHGIYPCQCITIDHPDHLYVTDDDIVTHNTFCALTTAARSGVRIILAMKAGFVNRWTPDLKNILGLKANEIYVVQGTKSLVNLINLAKEDEVKVKAIIFTTTTLDDFYSYWLHHNGDTGPYGCTPFELFELLKPGLFLRDEIHLEFYKFFRQELFSHVPKILSLSATLIDKDPKVTTIYNTVYPPAERAPAIEYDKYIAVTALSYSLKEPDKVRFSHRGRTDYSHVAYENWIMSDKKRLKCYDSIVSNWLGKTHIKHCVKGQRSLIFCATVDYCTHLVKILRELYPDRDVKRYTNEDPKEHLDAEIIISTIQSAGTAIDIPGLRYTLNTVAINSHKANIQALGRLRRLKDWPEITPEFYHLSCVDIRKHRDYLNEKIELFKPLVLTHGFVNLGVSI